MQKRSRPTLLLIDDDDVDRMTIRSLASSHYEIKEAETAGDGLDLLKHLQVDCVLLDYHLPDVDGLDVLPRVIAFGVPVIMLTSAGSEQVAVEALKRGAADCLVKNELDVVRLVGSITDSILTAALERQLAEKHEELVAFSHTVAHDIKAPLRAISFFSGLTAKECRGKVSNEVDEHLDVVTEQSQRLMTLVDDLLNYTRIPRSIKEMETVAIAGLLHSVIERLSSKIKAADAIIESDERLDASNGPSPRVMGDETALGQLFENLISNAIKFRRERMPLLKISADEQDGDWLFRFRDNGIGIAEKDYAEVFKPLRRLNSIDEYAGSGIGLATCAKIVSQHRGRMWVTSTVGEGSIFHVTLPAAAT